MPGLRPDRVRDDRFLAGFFAHGASDEGGREDVDESAASRRLSSAISSACSPTTRRSSALSARSFSTSTNSWS
ncbi:MAG: hypothetical protein M3R63_19790 [Actinomycetota bacterium]|nr:hypothetical protein [Actinomycetota bacterium]